MDPVATAGYSVSMSEHLCDRHSLDHIVENREYDAFRCACGAFAFPRSVPPPERCPTCSEPLRPDGRVLVPIRACPVCPEPDPPLSYIPIPSGVGRL